MGYAVLTRAEQTLLTAIVIVSVSACGTGMELPAKRDLAEDGVRHISGATMYLDFERQGDYLLSPVFPADEPVQRAGFMVDLEELKLAGGTRLQARGWLDGEAGEWQEAEITWREDPLFVARVELGLDATAVQIRVHADDALLIANLSWGAVSLLDSTDIEDGAGTTSQALSAVDSEVPGVISREGWGARSSRCTSIDSARHVMTIHHTVTPTQSGGSYEKRVRAIQAFHLDVRGWCDVGYHYLITADGQVFEGRPSQYRGAHVGGANTGNLGIAFVGCFQEEGCNGWGTEVPPEEMLVGAAHLLKELAVAHELAVDDTTVLGHRDHPSASTACPGANLYAEMQSLRSETNQLLSDPGQEEPEDPCGGVTYQGACDGNRVIWCSGDQLREYDCGSWVCGWQNDSVGYNCLEPQDPCQGLDFFGTCEGALLRWCQNETLMAYDCATTGRACGWQSDTIGNNCL